MSSHTPTPARTRFHTIATNDHYRYQPLRTSTTIRLIKICLERVNDHIACDIYHVDEEYQEAIGYYALSYVWGSPKDPKHTIYLRDQGETWYRFQLHENLWLFLDNAWQRGMFTQYIWTDCLCIDQSAPREKPQQVQRMHIIYRNAALVVTWLQLGPREESGLLEVVTMLDRLAMGKVRFFSLIELFYDRYDLRDCLRVVQENPYWTRIWIVQEVVVAKEVCVYTKRTSINLHRLNRLLSLGFGISRDPIGTLCNMRATGGKIPLWRLLNDFRDYRSTHDADRIYGIFGLAENNEDGSSPATNIQVDYKRLISHVMLDVTFESPPPLKQLREIILRLLTGSRGRAYPPLDPGFAAWTAMNIYINNTKTTERHRECANIALEALGAFNTMLSVAGTPLPDGMKLLENLVSSAVETEWRATHHQNAALLGLMLSGNPLETRDRFSGYRGRMTLPGYKTAWRCAAHGSRDACHTGLGSYETTASVLTPPGAWSRPGIVGACAKQSQDCNGSMMTYEVPHIGLRIQVEPAIDSGDEGRLSLHSMKFEA